MVLAAGVERYVVVIAFHFAYLLLNVGRPCRDLLALSVKGREVAAQPDGGRYSRAVCGRVKFTDQHWSQRVLGLFDENE